MAWGEPSTRIHSSSSPLLLPSADELEAADALLLFSLLPVMATKECHSSSASSFPNSPSDEDSLSHSSISDSLLPEAMEPQIQPDPLNILSIVASLHLIDTKGMQLAARDLIHQTADTKCKYSAATSVIPLIDLTSEETAANSLLSASSSITTTSVPAKAPSRIRCTEKMRTGPRCQPRLWRCAEEIMEFLMAAPGMVATEAEIRKSIGNGPDTSKALRLLVKQDEVKRLGIGGKNHPYLYMLNRYLS
ncbi:hypothetical protein FCM35_KLT09243 [Carex littledalei]|uniref:HTH three-helical bundle domain-containing protein n=1 Tax=Carex littledalei TaxID=544730 RepID=A0A833QNI2_9POAL|nr:hypothetical protein FCM35_KLT09243 [Carex littledalei]